MAKGTASKVFRSGMAAVLACTLCMPTQALAAVSGGGGSLASGKAGSASTAAVSKAANDGDASEAGTGASVKASADEGASVASEAATLASITGSASGDANDGPSDGESVSAATKATSLADEGALEGDDSPAVAAVDESGNEENPDAGKESETAASVAAESPDGEGAGNSSGDPDAESDGEAAGDSDSSTSGYLVDWTTSGTCEWSIDAAGALVVRPADGAPSGKLGGARPWSKSRASIKSVKFEPGVSADSAVNMFSGCTALTDVDLSGLDTTSLTDMNGMFYGCTSLASLDLSGLQTAKVTDMGYLFYNCSALTTLDVSGFNTSKVTVMTDMFGGCESLRSITLGKGFSFNGSGSSDLCALPDVIADGYTGKWLSSADGQAYKPADVPSGVAATYTAQEGTRYLVDWTTSGTCEWSIDAVGNLVVRPAEGAESGVLGSSRPWSDYVSSIKTATFEQGVSATSAKLMFSNCASLASIDLSGLDTSKVTSMYGMFDCCSSLASLDLSDFVTTGVTSMYGMFNGCTSLASLDLSGFDASKVTSAARMFDGCASLASLDLSGFDASKVTSAARMFDGCTSLASLDLSGFDTSKVTSMASMFSGCSSLTSLDVSSFTTSSVTSMSGMFSGCSSLASLDLSSFDTSRVTDMSWMFYGCSSLTSLDVSGFETPRVTDMGYLFGNCSALTSLDLSGFDTSKATSTASMFSGCSSLTSLDVSSFTTSSVTSMNSMFDGCTSLASLDLSGFDTSKVTSMGSMFAWCTSLASLDLSGLQTAKVTDMGYLFYNCSSLTSLDVSSFTTSSVTSMDSMFYGCASLTSLDLSGFDTSNLSYTYSYGSCDVFTGCDSLRKVILGAKFSFSNFFYSSHCRDVYLPAPSGEGLTGKWLSGVDGKAYKPSEVPSNVAATYTAQEYVKVDEPTVSGDFTYDGQQHDANVQSADGCTLSGTLSAVDAGTYSVTATPDDEHCWLDGTRSAKTYDWSIYCKAVDVPVAKTGLVYNGKKQSGVEAGEGYSVDGGSATNAGDYDAWVNLVDSWNYVWSDGTTDPKEIEWSIARAKVKVPAAVTGLVYNGKKQTGVKSSKYYDVAYGGKSKDAGEHYANVTLKDASNYVWASGDKNNCDREVKWYIAPLSNGTYYLNSALNKSLCVTVKSGSKKNGASVQLAKNGSKKSQKWSLTYDYSTGYYVIENKKSGKVLGVKGDVKKGANVVQQNDSGAKSQRWVLFEGENGTWWLRSAANRNLVLAVKGGKASSGSALQLQKIKDGSKAQWFKLKQA